MRTVKSTRRTAQAVLNSFTSTFPTVWSVQNVLNPLFQLTESAKAAKVLAPPVRLLLTNAPPATRTDPIYSYTIRNACKPALKPSTTTTH